MGVSPRLKAGAKREPAEAGKGMEPLGEGELGAAVGVLKPARGEWQCCDVLVGGPGWCSYSVSFSGGDIDMDVTRP